ncbi:hypothetical protein [Synechococcus virus S-ESS1]|uniref:Uncharacterized protein n=1 Tax=Synechococcus virus S-ESS1 TaxID=1964565 RepID=A0A1V0DX32_9CAUD|nr:hypothetical protein JT310_gp34 [Synechococcus virus S-ESS1]ARB05722.1 hypothetical protein [Synechococcus virus S-ESS1]
MAGERTLPGLGLTGFWDLGDDGWKPGMDENLSQLSALVQPFIASVEAAEPGAPADGDIHIASVAWGGIALANDIVIRDNGEWVALTPTEGWRVYNRALNKEMRFTGTEWIFSSDPRFIVDANNTYDLTDDILDGRTILELSNAGAVPLNIPTGLIGMGPLTVINIGGGDIAVNPGWGRHDAGDQHQPESPMGLDHNHSTGR